MGLTWILQHTWPRLGGETPDLTRVTAQLQPPSSAPLWRNKPAGLSVLSRLSDPGRRDPLANLPYTGPPLCGCDQAEKADEQREKGIRSPQSPQA